MKQYVNKEYSENILQVVGRQGRRASSKLLRLSKALRPGSRFKTGNGRLITITHRSKTHLYIKAVQGSKEVSIPLENIQRALAYFIFTRLVERKELELFHHFNSAVFGILSAVFGSRAKITQVKRNLLRLIMIGIRVIFAGLETCPKDLRLITQSGWNWVMFTNFYLRNARSAWLDHITKYNLRVLLDCGAYSVWKAQQKLAEGKRVDLKHLIPIDLHQYCSLIKKHKDKIFAYFVLDVVGDHKATMENLHRMEQEYGLNPLPVFHLQTAILNWEEVGTRLKSKGNYESMASDIQWSFDELRKLVEAEYPLIGLGGTVGQNKKMVNEFFTRVFNQFPDVAFHGLGVSNMTYLWKFPFLSCDSSIWIHVRRDDPDQARVLTLKGQIKRPEWSVEKRMKETIKTLRQILRGKIYRKTTFVGHQVILFDNAV